MSDPLALPVHVAALDDIAPRQLYGILALRIDVFAVEQDVAAYQDLDGRDGEPGTLLLWQESGGRVVSTLRLLDEGEDQSIGRVVTAKDFRGRGLATQLMHRGIELAGAHAIELGAQAHLEQWYSGFGFTRYGDGYFEAHIPHVHMRRNPS